MNVITNELLAELARGDETKRRATNLWPGVWPAFDAPSSVLRACLQGQQAEDGDISQAPQIVVADASRRVDWWRSRLPTLGLTGRQKQRVHAQKEETLCEIPEGAMVPMLSTLIAPYLIMRHG